MTGYAWLTAEEPSVVCQFMLDNERPPAPGFDLEIIGNRPRGITLPLVPSVSDLKDPIPVFIPVEAGRIFIRFVTGMAFDFYGDHLFHWEI